MDLINQSFVDNKTKTIHTILSINNGIALTDNIEKIPIPKLLDSSLYTPYSESPSITESKSIKITNDVVDPSSFFNSSATYNVFAEKIKTVDTSKMKDDEPVQVVSSYTKDLGVDNSISAIQTTSTEDEMAEVARKYGASMNNQSVQKQNEAFSKYLDEEDMPVVRVNADTHQIEEPVRTEVRVNNNTHQTVSTQYIHQERNPIHSVFDQAKRSLPFTAIINQSGYIPRLDFIELMEDSYETSIIDYLAEDYVNKLLSNPEELKNQVKSQIISLLGKSSKKTVKKESKPKTEPKKKVSKVEEEEVKVEVKIIEDETVKPTKVVKPRTTRKKQDVK
jgi:hypothetical protein